MKGSFRPEYRGICEGCALPVWDTNGHEHYPDGVLHPCEERDEERDEGRRARGAENVNRRRKR